MRPFESGTRLLEQQEGRPQWRYTVVVHDGPLSGPDLDEAGRDGWELVSVVRGGRSDLTGAHEWVYTFKRPAGSGRANR